MPTGFDTPAHPLRDLRAALGLLTRFPVRFDEPPKAPGLWTFPVVGAAVGAVAAGIAVPLLDAGVRPLAVAVLALAASALVTGALHEDGLADAADGLGGGRTREQKLEIMRDSRLGSYGALALLVVFGLRAAGLAASAERGPSSLAIALVSGHAIARALAAVAWAASAEARPSGLSADLSATRAGRGRLSASLGCLVLAGSLAVILDGWRALVAYGVAAVAAGAMALVARAHLGGVTGDVLGAVEQVGEAAFWTVGGA